LKVHNFTYNPTSKPKEEYAKKLHFTHNVSPYNINPLSEL
jgi:hypothetical protein